jgi:2-polyprenyl-3-methyl-5-hydroxy-6-metoxy-1,4-benzoquinol methylase
MAYNWDYLDKKAYNNKVGYYKFRREYDFIVENGNKHFSKIFDLGGGSGRFAIPLSQYSNQITVLDLNQEALQLLKERNKIIETIHSDFSLIELTDVFSLILCIEVIGHFQDWDAFFSKVNALLSEDGRFIFTYTNPDSWRYFLRKIKHWRNGYTYYNMMKLDEFKTLLSRCNFEIDSMEGLNWIPLSLGSNSIMVSFFEKIEKLFKLKKWYSQSPWILFSVRKLIR